MRKKTSRAVALSSTVLFACSVLLAACSNSGGNNNQTSTGQTKTDGAAAGSSANGNLKPVTFTVFSGSPQQQETSDNKIYKLIQDKLGVTFKMEYLVGDLQSKLGVMIAGGDYPDIITGDKKLISAGALIPLEDLIEKYAPNLKKHFGPYWNKLKDPSDGHIYVLPNYGRYYGEVNDTWYSGPAFFIQKAILKEMNYPQIKTLDQYFDVISKYKEKHPTIDGQPTIGFETLNYDWRNFPLFNPPEHLSGHPNDGGVVVDNNHASIFADKDISKKYYQKLNQINDQGLFDKESLVQNYDQYLAKLSSGRVLGMFDQHWNFGKAEESLTAQGKEDRTYVGFPLTYDGVKDYYRDRPALNLGNGYGITVKNKDPVRTIQMIDQFMTEDWQKIFEWGIEGEDYSVGKDGKFGRTEEQRKNAGDPTWKLKNKADGLFGNLPKIEGTFSDGNAASPGNQLAEYETGLKPIDKDILKGYGKRYPSDFFSPAPENPVYYPVWQIDLIQGSPAQIANQKLIDLQTKYLPKAILAKPGDFDAVWTEYVNQLHSQVNIKAIEDRYNDQVQWRIKNWSSDNSVK